MEKLNKKICNKCGIEKDATTENFAPEKKGKFGVKAVCRDCRNKQLREKRAAGIYHYVCTHCGKDYLAREKKYNKFCSRECAWEHKNAWENVVCECCSETFEKHRDRKSNLCSSCFQDDLQRRREEKQKEQELIQQEKKRIKQIKKIELVEKEKIKLRLRTKECTTCGDAFIGRSHLDKYCSETCRKKAENRKKELLKGIRGERIKSNGRIDNDISLDKLIIKDNNVCHICNQLCDYDDYTISDEGYFIVGNMYPSIDHVTAIANGGTHTWNNVRLAHMICNSIKSDKVIV